MIRRNYHGIAVFLYFFGILTTVSAQTGLTWSPDERERFDSLPAVTVATDSTWPPMEYINREGDLVGFDIDLLREIGLRSGFRPVFSTVPWDGIFAGLMAGHYQMIASSVTLLEERRRVMLFSSPYFTAAQYLVVRSGQISVRELVDLRGGDVGAQIGTTGARLVDATPGVTLRAYDDLGLAVEDLAQGRLAGIVADSAIVEYFILSHGAYGDTLRIAGEPYTMEQYAFAIRKDEPHLQRRINEGLQEIRADGTLQRLKDYWFPSLSTGDNGDTSPGGTTGSEGAARTKGDDSPATLPRTENNAYGTENS